MRCAVITFLAISLSASAFADTSADKIARLMKITGLADTWAEQMEMGEAQTEKIAQQALEQILSQLNPSEEFRARFEKAYNNYMKKTKTPWTAEEIVEVWAGYYGPNFTDTELEQLIEFYESELGKKDIRVTREAMKKFGKHFEADIEEIFSKAAEKYIEELQIVARECKCAKKSP